MEMLGVSFAGSLLVSSVYNELVWKWAGWASASELRVTEGTPLLPDGLILQLK